MIDKIQTLKNLNKKFPRYKVETLLDILDCYADDNDNLETSVIIHPKKQHIADKTATAVSVDPNYV